MSNVHDTREGTAHVTGSFDSTFKPEEGWILLPFALLLLFVCLPGTATSWQPVAKTVTLKTQGLETSTILAGVNPTHTFRFPIPFGDVVAEKSVIYLKFAFSPGLGGESRIRVSANGYALHEGSIKTMEGERELKIHLTDAIFHDSATSLHIELQAFLTFETPVHPNGPLSKPWLAVENDSGLFWMYYPRSNKSLFLADYTRFLQDHGRLSLLMDRASHESIEGSIWLYRYLTRFISEEKLTLGFLQDLPESQRRDGHFLIAASLKETATLPVPFRLHHRDIEHEIGGSILKEEGIALLKTSETGTILYLTGSSYQEVKKAIQGFLDEQVLGGALGRVLKIQDQPSAEHPPIVPPLPYRVSLRELRSSLKTVRGIGSQEISFSFHRRDLGRYVSDVAFFLSGTRGIVRSDSGFVVQAYLNGVLIKSQRVRKGTIPELSVPLPTHLLEAENRLTIRFAISPRLHRDELVEIPDDVFHASYFEIHRSEVPQGLSFNHLPEALLGHSVIVLDQQPSLHEIHLAAQLLTRLGGGLRRPNLLPAVAFGNSADMDGQNILAVLALETLPDSIRKRLPLKPGSSFRVISQPDRQFFYEVRGDHPLLVFAVLQGPRGNAVGLLTWQGGKQPPVNLSLLPKALSNLPGDVALIRGADDFFTFDSRARWTSVEHLDERSAWVKYRQRIRFFLLLGSWILLVSPLTFLYMRSQKARWAGAHAHGILLVLVLVLFHASFSYAGAWTQPQGKGLSIVTYYFYHTEHSFTQGGSRRPLPNNGEFTKHEMNWYVEYGLTDQLTFVGNFFYDFLAFRDNFGRDNNAGFSDQEIGLRYRLAAEPVTFSVQGLTRFPAGYSKNATPLLGNDQLDVELKLLMGGNFYKGRGYWNAEAGFRLRFEEPSDELRYQLLVGYRVTPSLEGIFQVDGIKGLGNEEAFVTGRNVLVEPDMDLIKGTLSVLYGFTPSWAAQVGGFLHLSGRNTGAGGGGLVALWYRF